MSFYFSFFFVVSIFYFNICLVFTFLQKVDGDPLILIFILVFNIFVFIV
jgi:hypothetical protein